MSRYCLDTSAYSQFKRGEAQVVELIDEADWIGVPSIVMGELWTGFLAGSRQRENAAELREFLAHSLVNEIPVDGEIARLYAEIAFALRRAGTPVPTNDLWIAAAATSVGATVLTYDSHFARIERVGKVILTAPV